MHTNSPVGQSRSLGVLGILAAVMTLAGGLFPRVAEAATVVATYEFKGTFAADEATPLALVPTDPESLSVFASDTVLGQVRAVWSFNGLIPPEAYSVDMVCRFTAREGAWRRLIDVQNRQSDAGFYVDPADNLDIYPVSGSSAAWTNNVYHHIVLTNDGSQVAVYLDGVSQFTTATTLLNLDVDPTDNPGLLMGFFLDNVVAGGQGEWSPGSVGLIRVWNGVLTADEAGALAANPFAAAVPAIAITSPPPGGTFVAGAGVPLAAGLTDPLGIATQVQFLVDGVPVGAAVTAAPYLSALTAGAPGSHTLSAVVTDNQGRQNTATETFNVVAANAAAVAPVSALLTPIAGRNVPAGSVQTLTFGATAADATALASVSLYADGVLVAAFDGSGNPLDTSRAPGAARPVRQDAAVTSTGAIFQTTYQMPGADKLVNMIVAAFDQLGRTTVSTVATVHAVLGGDQPPAVTLSGLSDGASVKAGSTSPLTIDAAGSATAAQAAHRDAVPVSVLVQLEYWIGQVGQTFGSQPPYAVNFQPSLPGKYALHAVATDSAGLSTISAPVIVDVTPAAVVTVAAAGGTIDAGDKGKIVFSRTGDMTSDLTVRYKVKGTAVAGVDYKPPTGTVTLPAGAAQVKVKLKTLVRPATGETLKAKFKLVPSTDGSYLLGTGTVATLKIVDGD